MRLQLALNVRNIDEAVEYYTKLLDCPPHKRRQGYANFAVSQPPLKLVLFENPDASERLNHLGVEVSDAETLNDAKLRLERANLVERLERDQVCCHATQDKVWSREPQGLGWEWYRITDDAPDAVVKAAGSHCCAEGASESC